MTTCSIHTEQATPSVVEEMVMNYSHLPKSMHGWRHYRIEYGFECSCPECHIWLPPEADSNILEDILNGRDY